MKIVRRSKVSAWQDRGAYTSQSFPGIAVTPSGRIVVSWRSSVTKEGVADQRVLVSFSDDGGESWSAPAAPFEPRLLDGRRGNYRVGHPSVADGRLFMHLCRVDVSRPERPFFNAANSGLLDCKIFLSESRDDGASWSEPVRLSAGPFDAQPTPITGPVLGLPGGELVSQFELNKPYDSPEVWRHLPVLNFSRDGGRSFYRHAIPARDPDNHIFYWDQRPLALRDGKTVVDFFWTWDNAQSVYHNITMSVSADRGETWSGPFDTGVPGQPGQPVEFSDGSLFMPLVDRTGRPKIAGRRSLDRGRSFTSETLELSAELERRQTAGQSTVAGAWNEMTNFSLGLPAGVASGHDTALVVWYAGEHTDRTDIEFVEVSL